MSYCEHPPLPPSGEHAMMKTWTASLVLAVRPISNWVDCLSTAAVTRYQARDACSGQLGWEFILACGLSVTSAEVLVKPEVSTDNHSAHLICMLLWYAEVLIKPEVSMNNHSTHLLCMLLQYSSNGAPRSDYGFENETSFLHTYTILTKITILIPNSEYLLLHAGPNDWYSSRP